LKLFLIFSVSFIFWSFIGWYPPLRFNLYSFGSFLTLLFCFQFALLNDGRVKTISNLSYVLYFISLNHWNYLGVIKINSGILLTILLVSLIIFETFFRKKIST